MYKKILGFVSVMVLSFLFLDTGGKAFANSPHDFVMDQNGYIVDYEGTSKDVVIPARVTNYSVRGIAPEAFRNKGLTSVILETNNFSFSIGDFAFADNNISRFEIDSPNADVTMPLNLTIGEGGFENNNLTNLNFLNHIINYRNVADSTFKNNNLSGQFVLPQYVVDLGNSAFEDNQIESLIIPDLIRSLGNSTFRNNNIRSIDFGSNLERVGNYVFADNNLTSIALTNANSARYAYQNNNITSVVFSQFTENNIPIGIFNQNNLSSIEIPERVTTIFANAFSNNQLTDVHFNENLASIGDAAFANNQLENIELPEKLNTIFREAFKQNQLTNVDVTSNVRTVGFGAFADNPNLTRLAFLNADTTIDRGLLRNQNPLICGYVDSTAQNYANTNGLEFCNLLLEGFEPEDLFYTQELSFTLLGGAFLVSPSAINEFTSVVLDTNIQTITTGFDNPVRVSDLTGNQLGWRLDVSASPMSVVEPSNGFRQGTSSYSLPTGSLSIKPFSNVSQIGGSNGSLPVNLLQSNTIIDDGTVTLAKSDVKEGMGVFDFTFPEDALSLVIDPTTTKVDTINYPDSETPYETTLTFSLVQAP
ncbi:hypothetical protein BTS2_3352 [Bacillus sp. TS-2]|nr:hypothetical protein BTS2_3352 [Bacillus sp. TS-2]